MGRLYHGWVVVGGAFAVMFAGFSMAYGFPAFFTALGEQFGAKRANLALVFSLAGALYFSLGAISGPLADRVGPRRVALAGVLCVGLGTLASARAGALWHIYLTFSLGIGVGIGFSYVPAIGAVQRWFSTRRGTASGIAVTGIGAGNLLAPPLASWLISLTDWRTAYLLLGMAALVIGIPGALLLAHSPQIRRPATGAEGETASHPPPARWARRKRPPAGMTETPAALPDTSPTPWNGADALPTPPPGAPCHSPAGDIATSAADRGEPAAVSRFASAATGSSPNAGRNVTAAVGMDTEPGSASALPGVPVRHALRSRPFALLYGSIFTAGIALFVPVVHLAPYARDHGFSATTAATLAGLIGAGSAGGRLLIGGPADRIGRRRAITLAFVAMAVMMLWWLVSTSVWALALFAVVFGMGYGAAVALWPALVADYFGPAHAGGIIGWLYTGAAFGTLLGPTLAGRIYDLRGSYTLPIVCSVLVFALAACCSGALRERE